MPWANERERSGGVRSVDYWIDGLVDGGGSEAVGRWGKGRTGEVVWAGSKVGAASVL